MGVVAVKWAGMLRIKNEARWIREVLDSMLPLCARIFVLDDHSTDGTVEICEDLAPAVVVFRSEFEGVDEARDKNWLLARVMEAQPDWVLAIDGDEVLERGGQDALAVEMVKRPDASALTMRVMYLWNSADQVRVDGLYGRFTRGSAFRLAGQDLARVRFRSTGFGGNFHCGNVPIGLRGPEVKTDIRLKHYGYIDLDMRQRKYDWYNLIDPGNKSEDCYRHMIEIPGARHAPGPTQLIPWVD